MYFMLMNSVKNESFIYVTPCGYMKLFCYQYDTLMTAYCFIVCFYRIHFTIFIMMSGWFLLASAIVNSANVK